MNSLGKLGAPRQIHLAVRNRERGGVEGNAAPGRDQIAKPRRERGSMSSERFYLCGDLRMHSGCPRPQEQPELRPTVKTPDGA